MTLEVCDPGHQRPRPFHTDLDTEYRLCHDVFGMDVAELAAISRAGVQAAFCADELRTRILTEIDHVSRLIAPDADGYGPLRGVEPQNVEVAC